MIGSNLPNPSTRRPPKARDLIYALLFIFHLILVSFLCGSEDFALNDSFTVWSWMVIVSTIVGAMAGLPLLSIYGGKLSEWVVTCCIPIGIFCQICFGNVLLLLQSRYSYLGVILLFISLLETFSYKAAKENLSFTAALLKTSEDILHTYGLSLYVACFFVIIAQTGVLLWWGVLFVGLITKAPSEISELLVGAYFISLTFLFFFVVFLFYFVISLLCYFVILLFL